MRPLKLAVPESPVSATQFGLFRVVFGVYLTAHFAHLVPYAGELFSRAGMIPDPSLQPTYRIFPNLLVLMDSPAGATAFTAALVALAVAFTLGWRRNLVALLLWYGWACLLNRNLFISNPGIPMVGWVLLACAVAPRGESMAIDGSAREDWRLPGSLYWGAWLILALGYTVSGVHKLGSPSWADGTAIRHLLTNPLARDVPWRDWLLAGPELITKFMTYYSLALEVLFLPLALWAPTRALAWVGMVGMHAGILTLVSFADLTLGVLMMHLFTVDPRWLPPRRHAAGRELTLFFDGVCGLCSGVVDFTMREDRAGRFRFSPLQSAHAARVLTPEQTGRLETVVLRDGDETLEKSDAVIRLAEHLGGLWRLAGLARMLPPGLRNWAYDQVARHRYRIFGKKETCRMPTPAERARFIL